MKRKPKKLKYQDGGFPAFKQSVQKARKEGQFDTNSQYYTNQRHNTENLATGAANYFPLESLILPGTPAIKGLEKLGNMAIDALNPLSGARNLEKTPQILEGQAAQNYLNSQMINKAGNRIGTKADLNMKGNVNPDLLKDFSRERSEFNGEGFISKTGKHPTTSDFQSGTTDVPAIKRAEQMDILKEYKPSTLNPKGVDPMTKGLIHNRYPYENMPGYPPKAAAYPDFHKNWSWDVSPNDINSVKDSPMDMTLRYHDSNQYGGPITDPRGQWAHPGQVTRIPSNNITMQGVKTPLLLKPNKGTPRIAFPNEHHYFPGASNVVEYPMKKGGTFDNTITWEIIED